ncbi:hypothetical protein A0H76_2369 [Hepatospora eriocheir]|uniref:Uncharacterized protein n=1 Tax=Hepatospora eriocheir TaxID=1081669 RepID=A0A1X0QFS3_9MICR|nr:hypothetical protein A0H76_2369 [Hepatospora eriocheir]
MLSCPNIVGAIDLNFNGDSANKRNFSISLSSFPYSTSSILILSILLITITVLNLDGTSCDNPCNVL